MTGWNISLSGRVRDCTLELSFTTRASPLVIVGPSGAGKTTLLRAIAGASHGLEGWIQLDERVLFDSRNGTSLAPEQRRLGYLPQGYCLFPQLSAMGNVAFGLSHHSGSRRSKRALARQALARFGVGHLSQRRATDLSGGEQQRVALARALACKPDALLLDEPLGALDAATRRRSREFICRYLQASRLAAIVVTHDVRDVLALGGEVIVLERGTLTQQGSAAELAAAPATEFIAEVFASTPYVPSRGHDLARAATPSRLPISRLRRPLAYP
jgi:molybdate transport system ATP-binding protein